jgi:hypothetical protein
MRGSDERSGSLFSYVDLEARVRPDGACQGDAVEFSWAGNDEMEPASGDGWAELQDDGSLEGEICLHNGDDIPFIARRSATSSTARASACRSACSGFA